MFNFSKPDNAQLNAQIAGGISGIVTLVISGLINNYVVAPVVQKGVDKMLPVEYAENELNEAVEEDNASE